MSNYSALAHSIFTELGGGYSESVYHHAFHHGLMDSKGPHWQVVMKPEYPVFFRGKIVGMIEPDLVVYCADAIHILEFKVLKSDSSFQRVVDAGMEQLQRYKTAVMHDNKHKNTAVSCYLIIFTPDTVFCMDEHKRYVDSSVDPSVFCQQ